MKVFKLFLLLFVFTVCAVMAAHAQLKTKKKVTADTARKKTEEALFCNKQIINYSGYFFDLYVNGVIKKEIAAYSKIQLALPDHAIIKFVSKGKTITSQTEVFCADVKPIYPVGNGEEHTP